MRDHIDMRGRLTLVLTDREGRPVATRQQHNLIVTSGRRLVAESFGTKGSRRPAPVTHIGLGTGETPPKDEDVALEAQRGDLKEITDIQISTVEPRGKAADKSPRVRASLTTVYDFDEVNDKKIPLREAATFARAGDGWVMYNRVVFDPVVKTDTFKLTLLWDVDF
jgi:hypothetical protein